jgi:hypothetical protein
MAGIIEEEEAVPTAPSMKRLRAGWISSFENLDNLMEEHRA